MALDRQDPVERVRALGQLVSAMPKAFFLGTVAQPPAVVVAASEDSGLDAARALEAALGSVGGVAGGNARLAQGRVSDPATMAKLVQILLAG